MLLEIVFFRLCLLLQMHLNVNKCFFKIMLFVAMGDVRQGVAHIRCEMAEPLRFSQSDQEPFDGIAQTHLPSNEYEFNT